MSAALAHGIRPVDLFVRGALPPPGSLLPLAADATAVRADLLDELAIARQGSSIIAVYRAADLPEERVDRSGPSLALAGIADPGNLGTLVRSAAAFGASEVLLGDGCADALGPRAVRASMGGIFGVPVHVVGDLESALADRRVVALDGAGPLTLLDADLSPPLTIVVGAERGGVPAGLLRRAEAVVRIPQDAAVESLNAASAGTIALWEAARRRG